MGLERNHCALGVPGKQSGGDWMKRCQKCRRLKRYSDFNKDDRSKDGYQGACRECSKAYARRYVREPMYHVIYDPCNTFSWDSSFTRNEVDEMLEDEYLAIGTRFRRGKHEYRVTEKMCLKVVERDKQRLGELA